MPKSPLSSSAPRTAMTMAGRMPVIAEDDSLPAVANPSTATSLPPPPSSRSTKAKNWARTPISRPMYPHPSYPPPAYVSRSSSRGSSRSTVSTRSLLSGSPPGSRPSSGASTPRSSHKGRAGLVPITTPVGPAVDEKSAEKARVMKRRKWHLLVLIIIVIGLVAGLSAGLTVGSRRPSNAPSAPSTTSPPSIFPAGSFSFNTALTSAPTNCTSNPSTWRCFPYQTYTQTRSSGSSNGSLATFFWTITPKNSYTYQISSSSNPFSPQFSNLSMTLLDGNSYDERLVFNLTLPKSVVPSAAITTDNKAATCVYDDTAFSATLWTRRSGSGIGAQDGNSTAVSDGSKWADWPGEIEVLQVNDGGPVCKDYQGKQIQAEAEDGRCECRYANFGLSE